MSWNKRNNCNIMHGATIKQKLQEEVYPNYSSSKNWG
jgi:hypothetical protein